MEKWRSRFVVRRLDGLLDKPRLELRGRSAMRRGTLARFGVGHAFSRRYPLVDTFDGPALRFEPSAVSRLARLALQPHRGETLQLSRDPLFIEKVRLAKSPPGRKARELARGTKLCQSHDDEMTSAEQCDCQEGHLSLFESLARYQRVNR